MAVPHSPLAPSMQEAHTPLSQSAGAATPSQEHGVTPSQSATVATPPQPTVTLPGTFKSTLGQGVTGDLTITIPGMQTLNELLIGEVAVEEEQKDKDSIDGIRASREFMACIHLTFRQSSAEAPGSPGHPLTPPTPLSVRRQSIECRGKISVSTATKSTAAASVSDASAAAGSPQQPPTTNIIRQYELMFVQRDFEPGQPFFAVNFNKTLVQCGSLVANGENHTRKASTSSSSAASEADAATFGQSPVGDASSSTLYQQQLYHHQHHDKGLMLSGHYTCLRSNDLGTVRVHLPPGVLTGTLAPQFITGNAMTGDAQLLQPMHHRRKNSIGAHQLSSTSNAQNDTATGEELFARASTRGHGAQETGGESREQLFASLLDANGKTCTVSV